MLWAPMHELSRTATAVEARLDCLSNPVEELYICEVLSSLAFIGIKIFVSKVRQHIDRRRWSPPTH